MILIELIILGSDWQTCLLQSLPDFMEKRKSWWHVYRDGLYSVRASCNSSYLV